jgi:hypothetical protein
VVSFFGPISEIWYLRDYWTRETITGLEISIEDFVFSFSLGGITFALFKYFFRPGGYSTERRKKFYSLLYIFPLVIVIPLLVFTNILGFNSVLVSASSFLVIAFIIYKKRRDLVLPSVLSGLLLLFTFILVYRIMDIMIPDIVSYWCNNCNPSGIRFININIEELFWDFCWGLIGGVIYEATTGKAFARKKRSSSSYEVFDRLHNRRILGSMKSQFGRYMHRSTKSILPILVVRLVAFFLWKTGWRVSFRCVQYALAFSPILLNIFFYRLDYYCSGEAHFWLFLFSILNLCLLRFPEIAWLKLVRISDEIDSLAVNRINSGCLIEWMGTRLATTKQLILSFFSVCLCLITLYFIKPLLEPRIEINVASYFAVFITSFLGLSSVYWIWNIPLLVRKIHSFSAWKVRWHSPATTPGIKGLSDLLGSSALMTAIGMFLTETPLLYCCVYISPSIPLLFITASSAIITSGTFLFILIFPQYWLSEIVKKSKISILNDLNIEIENLKHSINLGNLGENKNNWDKIKKLDIIIRIYRSIDLTPNLTVDKQMVATYTVALLTSAIPYIVQLLKAMLL